MRVAASGAFVCNVITLFNEGKDTDYWSPSSFHNGPPTIKVIKSIDYLINYQYNLPTKIT